MNVIISGNWMEDVRSILALCGLVLMACMTYIGYKVHTLLFEMKIPQLLAELQTMIKNHDERLKNLESKVFKL